MNIQFLQCVYYYVDGGTFFTSKPFGENPWLFWGKEVGYTEMTRREFISLTLKGHIIKICDL